MKVHAPTAPSAHQVSPALQLPVRSGVRAGLTADCALGVSYWRKELNDLKRLANQLNCA